MRKPAQVQCSAVQYSTVSTISTVQFAQAVRADALSPTVTQGGRATNGLERGGKGQMAEHVWDMHHGLVSWSGCCVLHDDP